MKTYCLTVLVITLFLTGFSAVALAASQEFTVINASGSDIYALTVTPANNTAQGPDALNGRELLSSQTVRVIFPNYNAGILQWDIRAITCCGEKLKWQQLNLSIAHTITLRASGLAELD